MPQVVIENPILNSPFEEPKKHFQFSEEGITNEVVEARRVSSYFVPIARPKKRSGLQTTIETLWTLDRIEENKFINQVRDKVTSWRQMKYPGISRTTQYLLDYWCNPNREHRLFFCQIEALETAIFLTEAAPKYEPWVVNSIQAANQEANPLLTRIAFKMATGSGKTVVMAMIIAWQALNKLANPQDSRFSDAFLVVTPGITIRDRLRVLFPNDPHNYYLEHDLLPQDRIKELDKAKIEVTNFHAFMTRELSDAASLTKKILAKAGEPSGLKESPEAMVRRVCRDLGNKKNILVINDEAHHCYRRKEAEEEVLTGEERREAEKRAEEARVWITGLEAVKGKLGIRAIYDLSATPFFLRGSGYSEGTLFPWVVSDFSLIDAIECGIVKVPRVPIADNQMNSDMPTYRNLWPQIKAGLPKKGRKTDDLSGGEPILPVELQGALHSLYSNYEKSYHAWEQNEEARAKGLTPPVFIVVCNNTNVSKLVYDFVSGWEKSVSEGQTVIVPGNMPIFSNEENGAWRARPNTILIDSEQLESGEAMSPEFKKMAASEIEQFKTEYRLRFPGQEPEDEEILREVMNTVGKLGKLGEQIKCVVSVSMLTEGWDANTVTHILGVRAFGTQLLCEQVVGRGLRRMSYATNEKGLFEPEYAEVYGVPFSFIPCSGSTSQVKIGVIPTRIKAMEDRASCEITFPRIQGYRYDLPSEALSARFTEESRMAISTLDVPTRVENAPIVGEHTIHTLDDLKRHREQEVAFLLAKFTLEKYFKDEDGSLKSWLFPQVLKITKQWLSECMTYKDDTFPQLLLLVEKAQNAATLIYNAIVQSDSGGKRLMPILQPYDTQGSTRYVDFSTIRNTYPARADKCHLNYVVADTGSWEQKLAVSLEDMEEVVCYVKNQSLGFTIPYVLDGQAHNYLPDFIVRIKDPSGEVINLIVEVTGEMKKDKVAKATTAKTLWVPAVNNHGGFGKWAFLEITDPWDAKNAIRGFLRGGVQAPIPILSEGDSRDVAVLDKP